LSAIIKRIIKRKGSLIKLISNEARCCFYENVTTTFNARYKTNTIKATQKTAKVIAEAVKVTPEAAKVIAEGTKVTPEMVKVIAEIAKWSQKRQK
jgi:hypothetical protein